MQENAFKKKPAQAITRADVTAAGTLSPKWRTLVKAAESRQIFIFTSCVVRRSDVGWHTAMRSLPCSCAHNHAVSLLSLGFTGLRNTTKETVPICLSNKCMLYVLMVLYRKQGTRFEKMTLQERPAHLYSGNLHRERGRDAPVKQRPGFYKRLYDAW